MRHALVVLLIAVAAAPVAAQESTPAMSPNPGLAEAYMRRMQSDLRNLFSAQEIHYSRHNRYAGPTDDVNGVATLQFRTSEGVELRVLESTARGWSGVASSSEFPGRGCALFVGAATAPRTPGGLEPPEPGFVFCDGLASSATMQSDLRNLMSAQEVYYSSAMTYTSDVTRLDFRPSAGVTIRITAASGRGNAAVATNGTSGCAYFVGDVTPPATPRGFQPTEEGRVLCD